uniref:Transcription elongation factor 1 homolog n=1 Tax=Panagrellus redivivus TaxID=6233 RepID=A0A7E4UZ20_PANRE
MKPSRGKKDAGKLATIFDCLNCSGEKTCHVNMDTKNYVADIRCHVCNEIFRTRINRLSSPIDVYCDWVDSQN